eukprot:972114-Pleurochrysis_carterae.AAC.7
MDMLPSVEARRFAVPCWALRQSVREANRVASPHIDATRRPRRASHVIDEAMHRRAARAKAVASTPRYKYRARSAELS